MLHRVGAACLLNVLVVAAAPAPAADGAPNVRLFEWERGIGVEPLAQPGMTVYLWFYEWNMFDAMKPGQHTQGTHQLRRALSENGRRAEISSEALKLEVAAATDGADLTLTVRNNAEHDFPPLAAIIPCFNPGPPESPTRNKEFANTNTFFLGPEGLERLIERQLHFNSALREATDRESAGGRFAWSDKWPLAEPDAAGGLLVRESTSGRWACGIAWEEFLSAQGHNPWQCMHLSVRVGPLAKGQSKIIRGRIWLLPGDKAEILRRYHEAFGRAGRPERKPD